MMNRHFLKRLVAFMGMLLAGLGGVLLLNYYNEKDIEARKAGDCFIKFLCYSKATAEKTGEQ